MTVEQIMQGVLERRGYCVVQAVESYLPGDVIEYANWSLTLGHIDIRPHKLIVVSKTDNRDYIEHLLAAGIRITLPDDDGFNYYRVVAE
jgi:hypothetical protein